MVQPPVLMSWLLLNQHILRLYALSRLFVIEKSCDITGRYGEGTEKNCIGRSYRVSGLVQHLIYEYRIFLNITKVIWRNAINKNTVISILYCTVFTLLVIINAKNE